MITENSQRSVASGTGDDISLELPTRTLDLGILSYVIESDSPCVGDVLGRVFSRAASNGRAFLKPADHSIRIMHGYTLSGSPCLTVQHDEVLVRSQLDPDWPVPVAASLISHQLTEAYSGEGLAIHAGAVALGDCGILIPGTSHAGKSTTTALLSLAGFQTFSDDVALLGEDLSLLPFPRATMLRNAGWELVLGTFPDKAPDRLAWGSAATDSWYVDRVGPDDPGEQTAPNVKLILLPTRERDAPVLTPLTPSDVVPVLVSQCFGMASDPNGSLESIVNLVSGAASYRINMSDIPAAVNAVNELAASISS